MWPQGIQRHQSKDWKKLNLEGNTSLTLSIMPENRIVITWKCISLSHTKLPIYTTVSDLQKQKFHMVCPNIIFYAHFNTYLKEGFPIPKHIKPYSFLF